MLCSVACLLASAFARIGYALSRPGRTPAYFDFNCVVGCRAKGFWCHVIFQAKMPEHARTGRTDRTFIYCCGGRNPYTPYSLIRSTVRRDCRRPQIRALGRQAW
jgi:hypothetical protein